MFVRDLVTGETTRVSVASNGDQANGESRLPSLSADGRYVSFTSGASNLVPDDNNRCQDIFVHDRQTGETTRVSVDSNGQEGNLYQTCQIGSLSADGRYVAFDSLATLVPDDPLCYDVFVHDRVTGQTVKASVSSDGKPGYKDSWAPGISGDGRFVTFQSFATNLVPGDTNDTRDIFVHDLLTSETERVSVSSNGAQADDYSDEPSISRDGRFVVFPSHARNLVPDDTNSHPDVFLHDRRTGETTRISVSSDGVQGNKDCWRGCAISPDGSFIAFASEAGTLVDGDTNGHADVFVRTPVTMTMNGVPKNPNLVSFTLHHANARQTGNVAMVLASCSGTEGFPLPGGRIVYLTYDSCTRVGLSLLPFFSGFIGADGSAQTPEIPFPPVVPGITLYQAAITMNPATGAFVSTTPPIAYVTQ